GDVRRGERIGEAGDRVVDDAAQDPDAAPARAWLDGELPALDRISVEVARELEGVRAQGRVGALRARDRDERRRVALRAELAGDDPVLEPGLGNPIADPVHPDAPHEILEDSN